jgi:glycosyltransferase involved in cell wall biosynthesis
MLDKLRWAQRIVVLDSGSTDGTLEIVARYPQVEVIHRPFDSFAEQCNFGLTQIQTEWVLSLDADYELSDELVRELHELPEDEEAVGGYRVSFIYRIYGRPLRGTLYPPRTVLYRVRGARYVNEGHGHRVTVPGNVGRLRWKIYHDDRKPLSRWFASQQNYARLEAAYILSIAPLRLSRTDRVRRIGWPAPVLVFVYVLLVKGCVLDGWAGWFYALQRLLAETMIALEVADRRLRGNPADRSQNEPLC